MRLERDMPIFHGQEWTYRDYVHPPTPALSMSNPSAEDVRAPALSMSVPQH